jgi:hypothetical protein
VLLAKLHIKRVDGNEEKARFSRALRARNCSGSPVEIALRDQQRGQRDVGGAWRMR